MIIKVEITDDNGKLHAWGIVTEPDDSYSKCIKLQEFLERIVNVEFGNVLAGKELGSGRNIARGCFDPVIDDVSQLK